MSMPAAAPAPVTMLPWSMDAAGGPGTEFRVREQQHQVGRCQHVQVTGHRARLVERAGLEQLTAPDWLDLTASGGSRPAAVSDEHAHFADLADATDATNTTDTTISGLAAIVYTSGTTSAPKGVLLRHRHLVSYVLGTVEFAAASEEDTALICVPPYHIAAIANVISNLFAGLRTVILDHFDARDWLATVGGHEHGSGDQRQAHVGGAGHPDG